MRKPIVIRPSMLRKLYSRASHHRVSTARSGTLEDSCGCAMSARFVAVALIASAAWYAWHWHSATPSIGGAVLRVLAWAFVAAGVGKILGIVQFRTRSRRPRIK
jgi:hypothetical protein